MEKELLTTLLPELKWDSFIAALWEISHLARTGTATLKKRGGTSSPNQAVLLILGSQAVAPRDSEASSSLPGLGGDAPALAPGSCIWVSKPPGFRCPKPLIHKMIYCVWLPPSIGQKLDTSSSPWETACFCSSNSWRYDKGHSLATFFGEIL